MEIDAIDILRNVCKNSVNNNYPHVPISSVPENSKAVVLSIPKSGTNLFRKCLELLTKEPMYAGHIQFQSNREYLMAHPEIPVIIPMRDPRDAFVSLIYHTDLHYSKYWGASCAIPL